MTTILVIDDEPNIIGLALMFNQMARQVQQSRQRLHDFVADVSHELRSPLTSMP